MIALTRIELLGVHTGLALLYSAVVVMSYARGGRHWLVMSWLGASAVLEMVVIGNAMVRPVRDVSFWTELAILCPAILMGTTAGALMIVMLAKEGVRKGLQLVCAAIVCLLCGYLGLLGAVYIWSAAG